MHNGVLMLLCKASTILGFFYKLPTGADTIYA